MVCSREYCGAHHNQLPPSSEERDPMRFYVLHRTTLGFWGSRHWVESHRKVKYFSNVIRSIWYVAVSSKYFYLSFSPFSHGRFWGGGGVVFYLLISLWTSLDQQNRQSFIMSTGDYKGAKITQSQAFDYELDSASPSWTKFHLGKSLRSAVYWLGLWPPHTEISSSKGDLTWDWSDIVKRWDRVEVRCWIETDSIICIHVARYLCYHTHLS